MGAGSFRIAFVRGSIPIYKLTAGFAALCVLVALSAPATGQETAERTYETAHFELTWVHDARSPAAPELTDRDDSGVPDAVERLAQAFEEARSFLVDELGYAPPPVDGLYRVYIASGGHRARRAPGGSGDSFASFIIVGAPTVRTDTTAVRYRTLAVHEYFHAIQLGYDGSERAWVREGSSVWAEEQFETEADVNQGALLGFLPFPRIGLEQPVGDHEYGSWIFLQFLVERYGTDPDPRTIVRELWEELAVAEAPDPGPNRTAAGAIEAVLARRGVTVPEMWGEFTLWQRRLGLFDEGAEYKAAVRKSPWPVLALSTEVDDESCRQTTDRSRTDRLPPLSSEYARFIPTAGSSTARLAVEGPPGATAFALIKHRDSPVEVRPVEFGTDGFGTTDLPFSSDSVKAVTVGLGNGSMLEDATLYYSLRDLESDETELSGPLGPFETSYGLATPFSGQVVCAGLGQTNSPVVVTERENVSGATRSFVVRSLEGGSWFLLVTPEVNSSYSAQLADPLLGPASTSEWVVAVRVFVSIEIADDRVRLGEPLHVSGTLEPPHPGASIAIEFRRPDGFFQISTEVQPDADGSYSANIQLPRTGIWLIRTRMTTTGDSDHEPGTSLERTVEVVD